MFRYDVWIVGCKISPSDLQLCILGAFSSWANCSLAPLGCNEVTGTLEDLLINMIWQLKGCTLCTWLAHGGMKISAKYDACIKSCIINQSYQVHILELIDRKGIKCNWKSYGWKMLGFSILGLFNPWIIQSHIITIQLHSFLMLKKWLRQWVKVSN